MTRVNYSFPLSEVRPTIIALQAFFSLAGIATAIGVAIIGHGAIIGEKQSGTAAFAAYKLICLTGESPVELILYLSS